MTKENLLKLLLEGSIPEVCNDFELIETHISWVLLCQDFAFKLKKPIHYSFLDFSTIEKREFFAREELRLNQRFAKEVYLSVLPVRENSGEIVDFMIKMKRLDNNLQMDQMLNKSLVSIDHINELSKVVARFHRSAKCYHDKVDAPFEKFNDLAGEINFIDQQLGGRYSQLIDTAIDYSNQFLADNRKYMEARSAEGFVRDLHGDLHSKNIFLTHPPTLFDCIEFNDDFRIHDIFNDVAFLCMDLDHYGRSDLSEKFIRSYVSEMNISFGIQEQALFNYYKMYRANVKAKVNALRAISTSNDYTKANTLKAVKEYLELLEAYQDDFMLPQAVISESY